MRPGRYPELGAFDVFRELLRGAIREWEITPKIVDGLLTTPAGQAQGQTDAYVHDKLIAELGIRPKFAETICLGGASFGAMVNRAMNAIREGRANVVLCLG